MSLYYYLFRQKKLQKLLASITQQFTDGVVKKSITEKQEKEILEEILDTRR